MPNDIHAPYFTDVRVHDGLRCFTLEDIIRRCAGYAMIHDFEFRDAIGLTDPATQFDQYSCVASGTASDVAITRTLGMGWGIALFEDTFNLPIVVSFTRKTKQGGFAFGYGSDDNPNNGWVLYWTDGTVGIGQVDRTVGVMTKIAEEPYDPSNYPDTVTVAVFAQRLSDFEEVDWMSVIAYTADHPLISASIPVSGFTAGVEWWTEIGGEIGLADNDDVDHCLVGDFVMPELHRVIEWAGIDPGESAAQGMNRAIATTRLFFFVRYDGTLKVWRPRASTIYDIFEVPRARTVVSLGETVTTMKPNHIRLMGAWLEGEQWLDAAIDKAGRRIFKKNDDPNLLTDDDIKQECLWALYDFQEEASQLKLQIPANPLLEPQDMALYPEAGVPGSNLYRIVGIQFDITKGKDGAPVCNQSLDCNDYCPTLPER